MADLKTNTRAASPVSRKTIPRGEDVAWFEEKSGLHASTMDAYKAWLRDGEFPIIVSRCAAAVKDAPPARTVIAVYTNFARCLYWWHGDKECDGVLYTDSARKPSGGNYLIPLNPYKSDLLSSSEHKSFPLTVAQCAALVLVAKECRLRAPRGKDVSIEKQGGNPLVEKLMALFQRDGKPLANFEDYSSDEDS